MGIFGALFDTTGFPARWYCGRWTEGELQIVRGARTFRVTFPAPDLLPRAEVERELVSAALPELRPA